MQEGDEIASHEKIIRVGRTIDRKHVAPIVWGSAILDFDSNVAVSIKVDDVIIGGALAVKVHGISHNAAATIMGGIDGGHIVEGDKILISPSQHRKMSFDLLSFQQDLVFISKSHD